MEADNIEERTAVIHRTLEIMVVLLEYNNFNGVIAITSAMNSSSVHRLVHRIKDVSTAHRHMLCHAVHICSIKARLILKYQNCLFNLKYSSLVNMEHHMIHNLNRPLSYMLQEQVPFETGFKITNSSNVALLIFRQQNLECYMYSKRPKTGRPVWQSGQKIVRISNVRISNVRRPLY